ncbi:hypothetical protein [Exiguobacterium sp. AM39-5BH]|uniref:hypothetical protein n=1 Tax=Exiguobacterium sp. AM39-5BH TaxID=2292355 RepID=UPI001F402B97|nr:hypothetical protein [Exiguobacterium sp. AM39-5BH]
MRKKVTVALLLATFLAAIEGTVVSVATPVIASELNGAASSVGYLPPSCCSRQYRHRFTGKWPIYSVASGSSCLESVCSHLPRSYAVLPHRWNN